MNERCLKCGAETDHAGDLHCRKIFVDDITHLLESGDLQRAKVLYQSANFAEDWKVEFLRRKGNLLDDFMRKDAQVAKTKALHEERLGTIGASYKGVAIPLVDRHRTPHCYNCTRKGLDSHTDLECLACGWIICPECGACKCGYVR